MKTSPITDSTFLRYFQETEEGAEINETFISLANLDYSGVPIDPETGDDFDCDGFIYACNGDKFMRVIGFELAK